MQEQLNESIDADYRVVTDSFHRFIQPLSNQHLNDTQRNLYNWYVSLMSKLNSMRAELSPCQQ